MDIKFIRDDTEEKAIRELNEILEVLSSKQHSRDVYAAKKFLLAMFAASKPPAEQAPKPGKVEQPAVKVSNVPFLRSAISRDFSIPLKVKARPPPKVPVPSHLRNVPKPSYVPSKFSVAKPEASDVVPEPSVKPEPKQRYEGEVPLPPKEESFEVGNPLVGYESKYPLAVFKDKAGVAIVRDSLDKSDGGFVYNVMEPAVDAKALGVAKDMLSKDLRKKPQLLDDERFMMKNLTKAMKKAKLPYSDDYADKLKYFLRRDVLGFGPVDPILQDPNVKSVVCDGINKPVKVVFDNNSEVDSNVVFSSPDNLNLFVRYLASRVDYNPKSGPNFEGTYNNWKVEGTVGFGSVSPKFIIRRP